MKTTLGNHEEAPDESALYSKEEYKQYDGEVQDSDSAADQRQETQGFGPRPITLSTENDGEAELAQQ